MVGIAWGCHGPVQPCQLPMSDASVKEKRVIFLEFVFVFFFSLELSLLLLLLGFVASRRMRGFFGFLASLDFPAVLYFLFLFGFLPVASVEHLGCCGPSAFLASVASLPGK